MRSVAAVCCVAIALVGPACSAKVYQVGEPVTYITGHTRRPSAASRIMPGVVRRAPARAAAAADELPRRGAHRSPRPGRAGHLLAGAVSRGQPNGSRPLAVTTGRISAGTPMNCCWSGPFIPLRRLAMRTCRGCGPRTRFRDARRARRSGARPGRQRRDPPGHLPPPGECRVWSDGRPPGHQPPPTDCREAERIAARDRSARVVYGGNDDRRNDDRWDDRRDRDDRRDNDPRDRDDDRDRGSTIAIRRPNPLRGIRTAGRILAGLRTDIRTPTVRAVNLYAGSGLDNGHKDGYDKGREDAGGNETPIPCATAATDQGIAGTTVIRFERTVPGRIP